MDLLQKTVLVAEDSKRQRMARVQLLETNGYGVHQASDGAEALRIFISTNIHRAVDEIKARVDVVVTDFKMPNMNGLTLAKEIQKLDQTIPVIVLSHEELEKLQRMAENMKFDPLPQILSKGEDKEALLAMVRKSLV